MPKEINNSTWVSPIYYQTVGVLLILIFVTLFIEIGLIYWFAKTKNYKDKDKLLLIVLGSNLITGLFGIFLSLIIWS